ncbi:MAG: Phosphoheptose isomerase [Chlamydiae bacterium]|nr:Phosphoheptose isomerase [Chlamydiota bacterium]
MRAIAQLQEETALAFLEDVAGEMKAAFRRGNKLLIAGNGGSLCDANHFAEELTGYFRKKRPALPAIALSEPGHLTCVGNDAGFDTVFSRGIEALGKEGDLFFGLTTSGNSENLVRAFATAKAQGLVTISFLGKGGGRLLGVADYSLVIGEVSTSDRIQEAHMTAIHILIEMVEVLLFDEEEAGVESGCLAAL